MKLGTLIMYFDWKNIDSLQWKIVVCHKLKSWKSLILCNPILQTFDISNDGSNSLNLKYQKLTLSGCKNIGIRKFEQICGKI